MYIEGWSSAHQNPFIYDWLVVSNIFIFHNIWDNPSYWRTHIFQDGYCTTNQMDTSGKLTTMENHHFQWVNPLFNQSIFGPKICDFKSTWRLQLLGSGAVVRQTLGNPVNGPWKLWKPGLMGIGTINSMGWEVLFMCQHIQLPSGYVKIAIENGHRNSGFSH